MINLGGGKDSIRGKVMEGQGDDVAREGKAHCKSNVAFFKLQEMLHHPAK
jgi:hypothetical protein